jgi:hypothetical protein
VTSVGRYDWVVRATVTALMLSLASGLVQAQHATRRDLRVAMSDTTFGFAHYASNGSARGDSARRIAALALWDLEGGEVVRGRRLLREAVARGVPDAQFYLDAIWYLQQLRGASAELAQVRASAERQFPSRAWPWSPSAR